MFDPNSAFLRRVLWFDAATCLAAGLGLAVFAGFVERAFALPQTLNLWLGAILLAFGAAVAWVASRAQPPRAAVLWIAGVNGAWAAASVLALLVAWLTPNTLGAALVIAQAVAVAVIAELQVLGLRRGTPRAAGA